MGTFLQQSDIITCESYKGLCDYVYKIGDDPKPGLVHCNMEELSAFFQAIEGNEHNYVVVSSCSDFGVGYLRQHPPWLDLRRWANMVIDDKAGLSGVRMDPRFNPQKFNPEDKYTAKCYSWTAFTFPAIPQNVKKWFMTNSMISPKQEPLIEVIPFGIAANSAGLLFDIVKDLNSIPKDNKVYINWVNYTYDRFQIKQNYSDLNLPYVTIVDEPKPYQDYLVDLASHRFVLSPEGNGVDCYRTLETIYMGSIPYLMPSPTSLTLIDGLDTVVCKTLLGVPYDYFVQMAEWREQNPTQNQKAKLSYWQKRFQEEKDKWIGG
jgi:hypothetical protein